MKHRNYTKKSFLSRRIEKKSRKNFFLTLIICAVLLYILFVWFIPSFISGLSFLNRFKNATTVTKSVSENALLAPPVLNIPYEATNSATIFIRGYTMANTSVEIYLNDELVSTIKSTSDGSFISDLVTLDLGKNSVSGKTIDGNGNKSYGSKPIIIDFSNEKPALELISPQDDLIIKGGDKKVTVNGKTNSDKEITVTINSNQVIVSSDGTFSQTIEINDGDNTITVVAIDKAGNSKEEVRKVTYEQS